MNEFKKLMGDAISDETAVALQTILDTHLAESATKAKAEVDKLQEELTQVQEKANELQEALDNASKDKDDLLADKADLSESYKDADAKIKALEENIETLKVKAEEYADQVKQEALEEAKVEHDAEITTLKEHAEAYAEKVKEEAIAELTEKAEAYGEYLQEKAEEYAEKVRTEVIAEMTEKADAYGDYLQEKAEEYGTFLITEADKYTTEQVALTEAKCLAEAEKQINEFKDQYKNEFERIDEHNRMAMVFKNLKSLIESSGFSIEESDTLDTLEEELRQARAQNRRLERTIRESAQELKELKVKELVEAAAEDLTFADKERIVKAVLRTRSESDAELSEVIKTLVENTMLNNNNSKANTNNTFSTLTEEAEQTANTKVKSGWAEFLK